MCPSRWKPARSRSLSVPHLFWHRRPLPSLVNARDVTCPPASAWFVLEPHRTGRGRALIPLCNALAAFSELTTVPTNQHKTFQCVLSSLTHFLRTSQEVTHPKIAPSQARLTLEFLSDRLPKSKCILLVWIVPINSFKLSLTV